MVSKNRKTVTVYIFQEYFFLVFITYKTVIFHRSFFTFSTLETYHKYDRQ